ncbi:MAG: DUF3768 domain-containing protein [Alphaproteobacteria bacterium]|nr:DUF3768 domain-containing protein [Alphaproteobacteria bacterium]
MTIDNHRAQAIAALNDRFRQTYWGGQVMTTCGVQALPEETRAKVFASVQFFDDFVQHNDESVHDAGGLVHENDPYGEHDFGKVTVDGQDFFWKIDYYDPTLRFLSDNPADPTITTRVLTIMLASEY